MDICIKRTKLAFIEIKYVALCSV